MQENLSLREQKRRETQRNIEDAATALVDEHGFHAVTIEEICAKAGISRRTFFNYFDSKDSAVLGTNATDFAPEQREQFLNTPTDNLFKTTLDLVKEQLAKFHTNAKFTARRQRIANDPALAAIAMGRNRARNQALVQLIVERLEAEPRLRTMPEIPANTEALLIASTIREAIWLAMSQAEANCETPFEQRLDAALVTLTQFVKGLTW